MPEFPESEIVERLRGLVEERTDVDTTMFSAEASLEDLGIDSFTLIEIVFAAEEAFGISLKLENMHVRRVQDVVNAIVEQLATRPA